MDRFEPILLIGYTTSYSEDVIVNNQKYCVQYFQGDHSNEYTICECNGGGINGLCELYCDGVIVQSWKEYNGQKRGWIYKYEQGVLKYIVKWENVFSSGTFRCLENTPNGMRLIIVNRHNGMVTYRGDYDTDESMKCVGFGYAYHPTTGSPISYGVYRNDSFFQIMQEFTNDGKMKEFEIEDGISNIDMSDRTPIYYGGCCYCKESDTYVRDGVGYVMDKSSGVAESEGVWKNGVQLSQRKLFNGFYRESDALHAVHHEAEARVSLRKAVCQQIKRHFLVKSMADLASLAPSIIHLVVDENACNEEDIMILELRDIVRLQTLVIKNRNFANTNRFVVSNCFSLKSVQIGDECFCHWQGPATLLSRDASLSISKCRVLSSVAIGCHSFVDFIYCTVTDLPMLRTLAFGEQDQDAYCFYNADFIIKDLPSLEHVMLGGSCFNNVITVTIEDLPKLDRIWLSKNTLVGKPHAKCSMTIKNLPSLETVRLTGGHFQYINALVFENIPNIKNIDLSVVRLKPSVNIQSTRRCGHLRPLVRLFVEQGDEMRTILH